jgi:glutaredoxin
MSEMPDGNQEGMPTLRVYIARHCPVCREALGLVEKIRVRFSRLDIQIIDLEAERAKNVDSVFSVPTYVLDGRTLSLGNPEAEVLEQKLMGAMALAGKERE